MGGRHVVVDVLKILATLLVSFAALVVGLKIDKPLPFIAWAGACAVGGWLITWKLPWLQEMIWSTFSRRPRLSALIAALLLALFPPIFVGVFHQPYWVHAATVAGLYVCLALGLNIVVGLAGLLDLGFVAFFAIGAYVGALFSLEFKEVWWATWLAIPLCAAAASLFGVTLGAPTLRLRGDYVAIVTLGFGEIIRIVLNNWDSVTNGPKGLFGIPAPRIGSWSFASGINIGGLSLGSSSAYYYATLLLAFVVAALASRLDDSSIGRAWRAIREDELAAGAMGIHARNYKLLAFACGAASAGVAGLLFAHLQTFVSPESFVFMESAWILCMVVLGGMGSIPGVVLGAVTLSILPEKLRDFEEYRMLVFGACLVLFMTLRPQGLIPARRRSSAREP